MPFVNNITIARVIHTVHISNLPGIVSDGYVRCPDDRDRTFYEIFSPEISARRSQRTLPFEGLTLGRYVSCLLTPKSPAHYAIATGYGITRVRNAEVVHLETSLSILSTHPVALALSDRNGLARDARVTPGLDQLPDVDWGVILSGRFSRDPADPSRAARAAAEVLVRDCIPLTAIARMVCWDTATAQTVAGLVHEVAVQVDVDRDYFFYAGR